MKLLDDLKGIIFGVANERSIGWAIAEAGKAQGATMALNYVNDRMARRVRPLAESIDSPYVGECDVRDDEALDFFFESAVSALNGRLDFIVHSLAFAQREELTGEFVNTSRSGFQEALNISTFSLMAIAKRARPHMIHGGSILTMSYYGAEKAIPNYNVMGTAKAALESAVRYLSANLGGENIRVNAISAGPVKTLSAAGIPGFRKMLKASAASTPLRRNVTVEEVADAAVFLLSPMATGITGEVLHVDAGYHAMGMHPTESV